MCYLPNSPNKLHNSFLKSNAMVAVVLMLVQLVLILIVCVIDLFSQYRMSHMELRYDVLHVCL